MMKMAPYYTEVPRRSFEAIVKNGWLSEILLALITDPLEAEDLAERLERIKKGEQLWVLPVAKGQRRYSAPISVDDFRELNIEAKTSWRVTMSEWVMQLDNARKAILSLTRYSQHLGVWCACQLAREALYSIPFFSDMPHKFITITESWVVGAATSAQVRDIVENSPPVPWGSFNSEASQSAYTASYYVARAASHGPSAVLQAENSSIRSANAIVERSGPADVFNRSNAELVRLREVVANACMTFPM